MLSSPTTAPLAWEEENWTVPAVNSHYRNTSVGSYRVVTSGRGFDWREKGGDSAPCSPEIHTADLNVTDDLLNSPMLVRSISASPVVNSPTWEAAGSSSSCFSPSNTSLCQPSREHLHVPSFTEEPEALVTPTPQEASGHLSTTPWSSRSTSPQLMTPSSPTSIRSRRRSTPKRVSLFAGRVMIEPLSDIPSVPLQASLHRNTHSKSSNTSTSSTDTSGPPLAHDFLGTRTIADFEIEEEIGRGAYGIVKRGRPIEKDGTLGSSLVIKQIIKSRILADCWKRHPEYGTIPAEIYVMLRVSNTSFTLPAPRPWQPSRLETVTGSKSANLDWVEGAIAQGHPNICPLIDFFEDNHFYYIVLPSIGPEHLIGQPKPPSDLFDLVEAYPYGLPPALIRTYLGQIADALNFLHSLGIAHRDVKDENIIIGPGDTCILIDFGSSGMIKSNGWDSFSGTLGYAGPEILRGERYKGKEQDVWAFGVVAYVLLVGECPFVTAADAQAGLASIFASANIALDERCADGHEMDGLEPDGGGALQDAAAMTRSCLEVEVTRRPTFQNILTSRFLWGNPAD